MYFDKQKYVVIIPSYNEIKTLPKVIKEIIKKNIQVIVVDDNSIDNSIEVVKNFDIIFLRNKTRLGYEKSLNRAFRLAKKKRFKYLATFDADGQQNTRDIDRIFKKLVYGKNNLVIGERSKKQRIFEYLFSIYTNKFFKINDPLSGLKALNLEKIGSKVNSAPFNNSGTHILLQCLIKNLKLSTIKIKMNKRIGKSRYGNFLSSNYKIFYSLIYFIYKHLKI
mgnify:CR=1 FL=1|tara:strand:- start:186 stop:851 length:666 start_codon:yes stop_codon:yes gene_type:complete